MKNKFSNSLFILASLLLPIATMADPDASEPIRVACSAESIENSDYLQPVVENWLTSGRHESEQYRERIHQLESNEGVFSYELVPELVGLGLTSQEQGDHAESAEAFQRALHIIRVNEGLYSTRQLPLIDLMIESNSALQEWKQVAQSYDLMYWLYRRNYADNDPRQLQALKRLRRWYMESYNKDTGRRLEELFRNSEKLYKQAMKIMLTCTGGNMRQSLCFWHNTCCADAGAAQGICPLDRG